MPTTKPKRKNDPELTVTTGWGQGRKVKFLAFADGERGLALTNVGPSTTIITAMPGRGDAIVELDGEQLVCWFRNLNPFPARVVVVHEEQGRLDLGYLDDVDALDKIADLGVRFGPQGCCPCLRRSRGPARSGGVAVPATKTDYRPRQTIQ